jgi:enolase-phosphatase E1
VPAQKLFFAHSEAGDLTPLFSGYFDTTSGGKREAASYRTIAKAIGRAPNEIVFLSDIVEELDAAAEAGLATRWLRRDLKPGEDLGTRHHPARSFADLDV